MPTLATPEEQLAFDAKFWVDQQKVLRLVEYIVEAVHPVRIVAFGSRARGTHRRDSDLDLAVIMDHANRDGKLVYAARSAAQVKMSVDILIIDPDRFDFMKDSIVSVESQIAKEGVVLYDSATASIDQRAAASLTR